MAGVEELCSVFTFSADLKLTDGLREVLNLPKHQEYHTNPPSTATQEDWSSQRNEDSVCGGVSDRMFCSACRCPFESREEQMEHYKLDWHRFNLRQRLAGRASLTVEEFEKKTGTGDLSSISGSDSEDDEADGAEDCPDDDVTPEQSDGRFSSRVVLQNSQGQYVSLYRCTVQGSRTDAEENLVDALLKISHRTVWVILMTGGGHFAGAVFQGKEILQHKTFHRYTVRAKRGTAQGLRDSQNRSHAPKSAGAALRRHNEAALVKDIQELLKSWAEHLKEASVIFLRTPKYNRSVFSGGRGAPLEKKDDRVRSIPFATRRATFSEIQRVHNILSTLNIYGRNTDLSTILGSCKRVWQKKSPKPVAPQTPPADEEQSSDEGSVEMEMVTVTLETLELREFEVKTNKKKRKKKKDRKKTEDLDSKVEDVEDESVNTQETSRTKRKPKTKNKSCEEEVCTGELWEYSLRDVLYTACKTGDTDTLRSLLQVPESPAEPRGPLTFLNAPIDSAGYKLLHVASASGHNDTIRLLLEMGSDPACRDMNGQTPYSVAANKDTRNTFRKFMADHPDKYNYTKAQVPGPLTTELESKKADKKKAQRVARKQREKEQKEEKKKEAEEEEEKRRFLLLSDREKRALAAEKRLAQHATATGVSLTITRRCWQCGESLLGKIPFEYLDFSFCSTQCVQTHRRTNAAKKS